MSDIPASPKLLRLEAQIKSERDRTQLGCLRAERAGFLGRQGFFEAARTELAKLQKEFSQRPDARVSVWIQIAEGWVAHYDNQPGVARDRMKRAYALSAAADFADLRSLSAGWMAHFAAHTNQFEQMSVWMKRAIPCVPPDFHPAQTRICMVLALAYHFARRLDLAVPWYTKCREHAFADGDDGSISAMSFNRAGLHTNHALQTSVFGGDTAQYVVVAKTAAATVFSFDQLVKTASLNSWIFMVQAMLRSADNDFASAIELYNTHLASACEQGLEHQRAAFLADRAWCKLRMRQPDGAIADAIAAEAHIPNSSYVEDTAVAYGRLAQVYEELEHHHARDCRQLATKFWQEHEQMRAHVLALLEAILPDGATLPSAPL